MAIAALIGISAASAAISAGTSIAGAVNSDPNKQANAKAMANYAYLSKVDKTLSDDGLPSGIAFLKGTKPGVTDIGGTNYVYSDYGGLGQNQIGMTTLAQSLGLTEKIQNEREVSKMIPPGSIASVRYSSLLASLDTGLE